MITLWNNNGESFSLTLDEWLETAIKLKETVLEDFNMEPLDIMYQLQEQGFFPDWAVEEDLLLGYRTPEDDEEELYQQILMDRDD